MTDEKRAAHLSCPLEKELLFGQFAARYPKGGQHTRDSYGSRALNVIVESTIMMAIPDEEQDAVNIKVYY